MAPVPAAQPVSPVPCYKLSGRTVSRLELELVQHLDCRDEERERLAAARLGRTQHVAASQQRRDRAGLNLSHVREAHPLERLDGSLRKVERGEGRGGHDGGGDLRARQDGERVLVRGGCCRLDVKLDAWELLLLGRRGHLLVLLVNVRLDVLLVHRRGGGLDHLDRLCDERLGRPLALALLPLGGECARSSCGRHGGGKQPQRIFLSARTAI